LITLGKDYKKIGKDASWWKEVLSMENLCKKENKSQAIFRHALNLPDKLCGNGSVIWNDTGE